MSVAGLSRSLRSELRDGPAAVGEHVRAGGVRGSRHSPRSQVPEVCGVDWWSTTAYGPVLMCVFARSGAFGS